MKEAHKHIADKFLAEGDYIRALEALSKANVLSESVADRIQETMDRLKRMAAREIATGRWTVAEGIFDAVREHQKHLTPAQRAECELLVKELNRCRKEEQNNGLLQAAIKLAAQGLHREAREVCFHAMLGCDDAHLAGRMRRLLFGLADPSGRLLYGFDSPLEIKQFCRADGGATIGYVLPAEHFVRGGYARVTLPGAGARVLLLDVPADWTSFGEISFWAQRAGGDGAAFAFSVGDAQNHFFFQAALSEARWTNVKLPLSLFERSGAPSWDRVAHVFFSSADQAPLELNLDEMRLIERPSKP